MKNTIDMAREAGIELDLIDEDQGQIWYITTEGMKAFEALVRADERKQALAAPVQEPKFVRMVDGVPCITLAEHKHLMAATPPAAQPAIKPLTNDQIFEIHKQVDSMQYLSFARAIEAAHGIKENT